MAKLPRLTCNKIARVVEKLGFVHIRTTGSHMIYRHRDGRKTVIPHHAREEIGPGLLNRIIKNDLGITREEFLKYL